MSYTIDVYYNRVKPEKNIFKFGLFVSFFPQLVAGPIERFSRLHHQLFAHHSFSYQNLKHGLRLMLWGLFIKMCVADNLSPIVDQVFNQHADASSIQLLIGMLGFAMQIYADFQGYSLIAIGAARVLGIKLIYNFNAPYFASSIRDFWNRWHISLSTWFRDYVYFPLGGSRQSQFRAGINILIVFVVSGLWHGANLTFLVWGLIHGIAYLAQKHSPFRNISFMRWLRWASTITLVCLAWVFFRANNVEQAVEFLNRMTQMVPSTIELDWNPLIISFAGLFIVSDFILDRGSFHHWAENQPWPRRWLAYSILLYSILGFAGTVNHPFIYFQF